PSGPSVNLSRQPVEQKWSFRPVSLACPAATNWVGMATNRPSQPTEQKQNTVLAWRAMAGAIDFCTLRTAHDILGVARAAPETFPLAIEPEEIPEHE
ncbi:MAG: hypothetical protein M0T72_04645, partial [Candidatus Dormibacteraeota bacterium]|nr:hypothetical protein [Candidatus Dormibacteraeota bacterium]